jgi:hypothetical protein
MANAEDMAQALQAPEVIEYRKLIHKLASGSIDQRIPNGKPIHAAILLEAMFDRACTQMRIFTGKLSSDTYDAPFLIEAAKRFVKKPGTTLKLLIQTTLDDLPARHFIQAVKGAPGLAVRFAQGAYSQRDAKHIAIMDASGFRFETDHGSTSAIANFNEPRVAVELASAFDRAFFMARPAVV